jgi:RNA polymerase sigma-70 factor (ECF subfamily)
MERYQQADPEAPADLINALSPALLRFFRSQSASREQADDLLQETWMRIHRVRHTYRPGEPVLPWVYAIARRVRVDGYRRSRRVTMHETAMEILPEIPQSPERPTSLPDFETLMAAPPETQREVITMLKVGGLTLEEVARATSSTVGAVKQKAHRAYDTLRTLLQMRVEGLRQVEEHELR